MPQVVTKTEWQLSDASALNGGWLAPLTARDLVTDLGALVQVLDIRATDAAKRPLLEELRSLNSEAAQKFRTSLLGQIDGIQQARALPVEVLIFLHELKAEGFRVGISDRNPTSPFIYVFTTELNGNQEHITIDLDHGSQGYQIDGCTHSQVYRNILVEMVKRNLFTKTHGSLNGNGQRWDTFSGTGIVA